MRDVTDLLEICKSTACRAGLGLLGRTDAESKAYAQDNCLKREIKAVADAVLNEEILASLVPTGLPILSEESGWVQKGTADERAFIVDPLDGTFNYVKGLGPSAISIALWQGKCPIFGVIYSLCDRQVAWGGAELGAYVDGRRLSVSTTSQLSSASICTGFPARFSMENPEARRNYWNQIRPFAKVRMLGSAAVSLLNVARGAADAYCEHEIMIWDVAAGLAIVEGAGGTTRVEAGSTEHALHVFATNGRLPEVVPVPQD